MIQLALIKQHHARGSAVIANIIMDGWITYSFKKMQWRAAGQRRTFKSLGEENERIRLMNCSFTLTVLLTAN